MKLTHRHTAHPQGESMACSFFDFLNLFHHFYFPRLLGLRRVDVCCQKKERTTVRHPESKRESFRRKSKKKYSESFELVFLIYLFIFGYFIFKACDLIRLSLLFLYKLLGDAIHRHHNCNRNNMIISKSELALAPAAKTNRTHTHARNHPHIHKHTSHPY